MNHDMYTISQVLGSHYPVQNNKLSELHNLLYVNKDSYQGSLDRYQKEECQLPISKQEFINYFTHPFNHKMGVFIFDYSDYDFVSMSTALIWSYDSILYTLIPHLARYHQHSNNQYNLNEQSIHELQVPWKHNHHTLNSVL